VVSPRRAQTIHGFGASGAWWPHDLIRFSPETRERVADLLFGPDGLALSVYRYNIGGGGVGVTRPFRAPETFMVEPGAYDWSRDPGGRFFLRRAAAMGVPVLVGFVNSAPAAWTTNGRCCGGALRPGAEADYARYLVDVVLELQAREGATLSYVSPMNEPDDSFPAAIQEGMAVPLFQRLALVRAVAAELARRAPFAMVTGDESSRVLRQFLRRAPVWLGLGGVARVGAVVHHLYDFPSDLPLRAARLVGAVFRKPMWMSEICCFDSRTGGYGQQYDPTMAGAMPLANLVWRSLALARHAAFHWWLALSPEIGADPSADPAAATRPNDLGWNDGLVYYDPRYAENGNERLYVTKRFWALANFSRYVRPGAVRHAVRGLPDDVRVLAFRTADGWTLVAIANAADGACTLRVRVPVEPGTALGAAAAHETSPERDLEPVAAPDLDAGGLLTLTLPAQSVTTVLVPVGWAAG